MSDIKSSSRVPALDGVRGVAVLVILFHHLVLRSGIDQSMWWDRQIYKLAHSSWLGVDIFFVLSGFLITGILLKAKGSDNYFRSFYGRRILRIFPLYYGYLLLVFILVPLVVGHELQGAAKGHQVWYWFYLSNINVALEGWPQPGNGSVGHFWSLAIEEQFYLLWPFAVWSLDRSRLLYVAAACFFGAIVFRIAAPEILDIYVLLPTRMDSLAAGACLAIIISGDAGTGVLGKWPLLLFWSCTAMLLAFGISAGGRLVFWDEVISIVGYTIIAAAVASLIGMLLIAREGSLLLKLFSSRTLTFFGKYSYGLYVLHVPVIAFLYSSGFQAELFPRILGSSLPGVFAFSVIGGALSVLFAILSYHFWEARFLRLKRYFPYRSNDRLARGAEQAA